MSEGDTVIVCLNYTIDGVEYGDYRLYTVSSNGYITFQPITINTTGTFTFVKVTIDEDESSSSSGTTTTAVGSVAVPEEVPTVEESEQVTDVVVVAGFNSADVDACETANDEAASEATAVGYANYIAYALDINFTVSQSQTGSITLAVDGIGAGDKVVVLHYYDKQDGNGFAWYKQDAEVTTDGKVKISGLTAASPFMVIKDTTVSTSASSASSTSSASIFTDAYGYWNAAGEFVWYGYFEDGVFIYTMDPAAVNGTVADAASPKTGEGAAVAVVACVMLLAGVAACGLTRKEQL